jgi:Tfp pilus assembly protein PilF
MDLALNNYRQAVESDPKQADPYYYVAATHATKGNTAEAAQWYKMALDIDPKHVRALVSYGLMLLKQRQFQVAEVHLKKANEIDSNRWQVHNGLGVICDYRRDYKCSEAHYQSAMQHNPNKAVVYTNWGYSKYLAGKWAEAKNFYDLAIQEDPHHEKAWANLGLLHIRTQEYSKGMDAFRNIMGEPDAASTVGQICMVDKKYKRAEEFFNEAIKLTPSYNETAHKQLDKVREEMMREEAKGKNPLQCSPDDGEYSPFVN